MKVLSLFDGMACGMLAMQAAGITVERYVAFEIDKYAVQTSTHNFPMIEHRGDVFKADFTEFSGFDFLVGGSPCTYWSIAQKNNRETVASGMGWELFSQYVRALREAHPMYFIYENNKSMSKAIRESITETFGFDPICINSALVSAQNRQRLYWVGKRNLDGSYSKVHVEQPEDRGILLKHILDSTICELAVGVRCRGRKDTCGNGFAKYEARSDDKANTLDTNTTNGSMVAVPIRIPEYGNNEKARCVTASYAYKGSGEGSLVTEAFPENPNKQVRDYIAEPVQVGALPRPNGDLSTSQGFRIYSVNGKSVTIKGCAGGSGGKTGLYAIQVDTVVPFVEKKLDDAVEKFGYVPEMWNPYNNAEITEKTPTLTAQCNQKTSSSTVLIFVGAVPCEWDEKGIPIKAVSGSDGKTYTAYQVKDGFITIKGKTYPIKLQDGFYIIRKLTVSECKRLQTVPEWYEFPVSNTQAYKMLGNGWTVLVIAHLIIATQTIDADDVEEYQLNLFEMVGV